MRTLLGLFLFLLSIANAAGYYIKGECLSTEGEPLQGVCVSMTPSEKNDSTADVPENGVYTYSDINGSFELEGIAPEVLYDLCVSKAGYKSLTNTLVIPSDIPYTAFYMEVSEEEEAKMLEEVEVTANVLENYTDRTELYLTSQNRKAGINALDAIASLPLFKSGINVSSLTNLEGARVNVLINGRRASEDEIRNLKGTDIKKVVYYDNAPAKFASYFGGPVANIILAKPKELLFTGNIGGSATTLLSFTGNAGVTLMAPLHYVNAAFNINSVDIKGMRQKEYFDYGDLTNSFSLNSAHNTKLSTNSFASYQFDKGRHMLYAGVNYNSSTITANTDFDIEEVTPSSATKGERIVGNHNIQDLASIDIYYNYNIDDKSDLSIDILNAYNKTSRSNSNYQHTPDNSAYSDFDIRQLTHNDIYTFKFSAMYSTSFWDGFFTANLYESYVNLHQRYSSPLAAQYDVHNHNQSHSPSLAVSYNKNFNRFGAMLTINAIDDYYKLSGAGAYNDFRVYPRINLSYRFSSNLMMRMMGWLESATNSLGAMNSNRYFLDTRYFSENLAYEHTVYSYCGSLSASWSLPELKLFLLPYLTYRYIDKPYIDYIQQEGRNFIRKSIVVPNQHSVDYYLSATWRPVQNLSIQPTLKGTFTTYKTPLKEVRFNWLNFELSADYSVGSFQIHAECSSPTRQLDGVNTINKGWSASASAYWKHNNFHAGLTYSFSEHNDWTITEIPGFTHYSSTTLRNAAYQFAINLGYYFQTGRNNQNRRGKRLSNSASETGFSTR